MDGKVGAIMNLFLEDLNVEIEDVNMDLVDEGLMDSLMLVDLLTFLEQQYQITVELEDLDIDNFRTVNLIAKFVDVRQSSEC